MQSNSIVHNFIHYPAALLVLCQPVTKGSETMSAAHVLSAPVPLIISLVPEKNSASENTQSLLAPDLHIDSTEFIVMAYAGVQVLCLEPENPDE